MADIRQTHLKVFNRIVDFLVLGVTFFVSSLLFSVVSVSTFFFQALAYSTLLLVCVQLCKHSIVSYNGSIGEASRQILGNGAGILIGTCIMLVIETLVSDSSDIFAVVIFSSVMAFFIMGTLSPMVHKMPIVHKKPSPF
jgi:hypothetical protein